MKRFLPAGERYAFLRPSNPLYILLFILFISFHLVTAQQSGQKKDYYKIGDKLRKDFVIGYDPFDHDKKYTLNDFKGKAVILDIWATWCSACIGRFPLMDSLSNAYGDQLQVLLVGVLGRDTPETIRSFVESYREKYPDFSLTFLIEENKLNQSFDFRFLPHYVWVDPNRRVRAYTSPHAFEDEHLKRLLAGRSVYVPIKIK